jgi:hypothetical protein
MNAKPTQTTPKGETIPVPARKDVMAALRKVASVPATPDDATGTDQSINRSDD